MLKNFLTIGLRNLRRQLLYSSINIIGLAVGMACSLTIFLYVYSEWSHDRHFENGERIYRIGVSFFNMGNFANGPELLAEKFPQSFDGIEALTAFQSGREPIQLNNNVTQEQVYFVDSAFFKVFSYAFAEGNPTSAMSAPGNLVMTESAARKYFGDAHALGKTLEIGKERKVYAVTGIVKDDHRPSHLKGEVWVYREHRPDQKQYWTSAAVYTYALLRPNFSEMDLEQALDRLIDTEVYPASGAHQAKVSLENYRKDPNSVKFIVYPLHDIYLKSKLNLELSPGGNEANTRIFGIIAVFILLLAGVNFVNLSTARASRRAKEVGVRKSLGTSQGKLVMQFLSESVLVSLFAMVLALGLAEVFALIFHWITDEQLLLGVWANRYSVGGVVIFTIVVGVLAGLYPAFYLTSFQPVKVLKGNFNASRSQGFRNALVVFQFSISIALIICTLVIVRQLSYMSYKDLGFNQENVLTVETFQLNPSQAHSMLERLRQESGVVNATLHAGEPASKAIYSFYTYKTADMTDNLTIHTYFGDDQYLDVMGYHLLKGRNFDRELASDTASVILNESAVKALGLKEPVGAVLNGDLKVIGVVADFHWESLRNAIAPIAIMLSTEKNNVAFAQLGLKVQPTHIPALLKTAEAEWKARVPDEPFRYHFLDDNFGALLKKEAVLGKAIAFFTVLAILISCLGLFGLAAYTTDQRTKEIGIRKVLGASVAGIVIMLNKQFSVLVLISVLIAVPVSYYASEQWLSGFTYRTALSAWIFIGSGVLGLLICYITVGFHSLRASRTNPADTLKCE